MKKILIVLTLVVCGSAWADCEVTLKPGTVQRTYSTQPITSLELNSVISAFESRGIKVVGSGGTEVTVSAADQGLSYNGSSGRQDGWVGVYLKSDRQTFAGVAKAWPLWRRYDNMLDAAANKAVKKFQCQ